ncbi:hypothetical protein LTS10_012093 [Elasticomyces elasticus]|nr:hypothetical protein LTS10_012093 [Elasticomyces elasticus]
MQILDDDTASVTTSANLTHPQTAAAGGSQLFKIPKNVIAAMEASYEPTAAQLFLADVKREHSIVLMWQEVDEASPSKCAEYQAWMHERKQRAVYKLAAKQRFLVETCAALGVSEKELSYASLESALQARAQAGRL